MSNLFLWLAEPEVLWSLFAVSITLVLLDYLLPVDWLAYIGYGCFALFVGATIPAAPIASLGVVLIVAVGMLLLHEFYLSRFLTNAPHCEHADVRLTESISTKNDP